MIDNISILRECSKTTKSGDLFIDLGEHHLKKEEWGHALKSINKGIDKGGLTEPRRAYTLLAITYKKLNRYREAISSFKQARDCRLNIKLAEHYY